MNQTRNELINALTELGKAMKLWGENAKYDSFSKLIDKDLYEKINKTIQSEHHYNGWFTENSIRLSLLKLSQWLTKDKLEAWTEGYTFATTPKTVGIIMAGNIPLVGFHDFLAVLLSGHRAKIKLASNDQHLFPLMIEVLTLFYPNLDKQISICQQLKGTDAVVATGSDNSARYFEKYFGHNPSIIRKNRSSVAILNGKETEEDMKALGNDVFTYFGLGCRNVSQLFIPKDFDMNRFFAAQMEHASIINHNKYANNYDYYKAIYLMNQVKLIENGFLLTKESKDLFAPIAVLFVHRYKNKEEVDQFLKENNDKIQVVVGEGYIPFGQAQSPKLTDYADGINTLEFLTSLN